MTTEEEAETMADQETATTAASQVTLQETAELPENKDQDQDQESKIHISN